MDKQEADVRKTAAVRMLEKGAATYASHPIDFVDYLRTVEQKYPDVAIVAEIKSLVSSSERHEETLEKVRSLLKSASEVTERLRAEVNATAERTLAERRRRRRLQIEIRPTEEHIVARLMEAFSTNESDAGRQMLQIVGRLIDLVDRGSIIAAHPVTDETAVDALPDLTRAMRRDVYRYRHLVELPHPWRRQLYFKGRRLTVSQVIDQMRANRWSVDQTADEFDLTPAAIAEALEYAVRNESLLREEAAEERRRAQMGATQRASAAG